MEYIVNFKTTRQVITDSWDEMFDFYNNRSDISTIFAGEDVIFSPDFDRVLDFKPKGVKLSSSKIAMDKLFLQFPDAIQGIMLASHFGHEKYKKTDDPVLWDNFKNVPDAYNEYKSAGKRHEFETEETEESGLSNEFHIAWNAIARFQIWLQNNKVDVKELATKFIPKWKDQFK